MWEHIEKEVERQGNVLVQLVSFPAAQQGQEELSHAAGGLDGTAITLVDTVAAVSPILRYSPLDDAFLLAWRAYWDDNIYAQIVSIHGAPQGGVVNVALGTADEAPRIAANTSTGGFLVVWTDARSRRVWAADVNPSGRSRAPFELQAVGESVDPRILAATRVGNRVVVAYAVEGSSDLLRVASVATR